MKKTARASIISISVALASAFGLQAQSTGTSVSDFTLVAKPVFTSPLLSGDFGANELIASGLGGRISLEYGLAALKDFSLRGSLGFSSFGFQPTGDIATPGSLNEASLLAGAAYSYGFAQRFVARGFVEGGLIAGILSTGDATAYASARAGASLEYGITDRIAARLEAAFDWAAGLYAGPSLGLGAAYRLPAAVRAAPESLKLLDFKSIDAQGIFPIFRAYYDSHALGSVTIVNASKEPVSSLRLSLFIKQYMDAPKDCASLARLGPGESATLPLNAVFNDSILGVTEATKAAAEIVVSYDAAGVRGAAQSRTASVVVYDRNAMNWSDDRRAAAFVSNKDPWVQDLTGHIMAAVKDGRNAGLAKNLQTAIAVHQGLDAYRLGYMIGTERPIEKDAKSAQVVDSIKFPRQTLGFRAGDCADLSVLYASCLEAAGVETAFITIPGHIFMAAELGLGKAEAKARRMDLRELIEADGRLWVPVETTLRSEGFMAAWRKAAEEWRSASAQGKAAFYPIHAAWLEYAPVGLPADGSSVAPPPAEGLRASFKIELAKAVDAELGARLAALGPVAEGSPRARNARGILYSQYGKLDEAEADFSAAAAAGSEAAGINLGHVAFLRGDKAKARQLYRKVAEQKPDEPRILEGLAKAALSVGDSDLEDRSIARLREIDPQAAERCEALRRSASEGAAGGKE
jgi:tetratricopeptide (TPR) repeat protein